MSAWLIDAIRRGPLSWRGRARLDGVEEFRWVCDHRHLLESRAIKCARQSRPGRL